MPIPRTNETHDEYIERCIPVVIEDGTAEDGSQARAVCESMWEQAQEKDKGIVVRFADSKPRQVVIRM